MLHVQRQQTVAYATSLRFSLKNSHNVSGDLNNMNIKPIKYYSQLILFTIFINFSG